MFIAFFSGFGKLVAANKRKILVVHTHLWVVKLFCNRGGKHTQQSLKVEQKNVPRNTALVPNKNVSLPKRRLETL